MSGNKYEFFLDIVSPILSVNCLNWIDPDDSLQTLVYLFETVIRRNLTHGEDDVVTIIYEGSKCNPLSSNTVHF